MQCRVFGFRLRVAVLGSLIVASTGWTVRAFGQSRSASVNELVMGFNAIGDRAVELRRAMRPDDAEAFDAVMRDVMSVLIALPGIAVRTPHDSRKIVPPRPRADRIGQLQPDLNGLERFFGRLSGTTANLEARQMFERAQASSERFDMISPMNFWVSFGLVLGFSIVSAVVTYLLTSLRSERKRAELKQSLAEAAAALENEKAKFEEAARGIEENAKRKALDEFLADLRVEERRYVREHRILFAHRKSLVLRERIFFRNVPISSWVEHEVPVEEGADLDAVAKTLSVFDGLSEGAAIGQGGPRGLLFSK